MTDKLINDINILCNNCNIITNTLGEAFTKIVDDNIHVIKLPNRKLNDLFILKDNSIISLVNIISNFRTPDNNPIGYLNTKDGEVVIPIFWPTNFIITKKYGIPYRKDYNYLIVDAYLVNNTYQNDIIKHINDIPNYKEWI